MVMPEVAQLSETVDIYFILRIGTAALKGGILTAGAANSLAMTSPTDMVAHLDCPVLPGSHIHNLFGP